MKKGIVLLVFLTVTAIARSSWASEAIPSGKVEQLTYRNGYVMFKVNSPAGNGCASCAADPVGFSSGGFCWVQDTNNTIISMLLMSQSRKDDVYARVLSWQDCSVYQLTSY